MKCTKTNIKEINFVEVEKSDGLSLEGYSLSDIKTDNDNCYMLISKKSETCCIECNSIEIEEIKVNKPYTRVVRDFNMYGKRTGLTFEAKHYVCKNCGHGFHQLCDEIAPKYDMTERLLSYIITEQLFLCSYDNDIERVADQYGYEVEFIKEIIRKENVQFKYKISRKRITGI